MDAINGISLERYAELCAKMNDVMKDDDACVKIAESEGVTGGRLAGRTQGVAGEDAGYQ